MWLHRERGMGAASAYLSECVPPLSPTRSRQSFGLPAHSSRVSASRLTAPASCPFKLCRSQSTPPPPPDHHHHHAAQHTPPRVARAHRPAATCIRPSRTYCSASAAGARCASAFSYHSRAGFASRPARRPPAAVGGGSSQRASDSPCRPGPPRRPAARTGARAAGRRSRVRVTEREVHSALPAERSAHP